MSILTSIIETKKQEVASLPTATPSRESHPSFVDSVLGKQPSLIAEIKPRSPFAGELVSRKDIAKLVGIYNRHAQAISILCDRTYFGGGFDLLGEVRSLTDKPLLAKEFILSERQIAHAAANGADAILLIVTILETDSLYRLTRYAISLGLDVLIEVHTEEEVGQVTEVFRMLSEQEQGNILVGINNRDLGTLETDIQTTERLAPLVRKQIPVLKGIVTESGIFGREDIERLQPLVQGFLIGTSILQADDPALYIASLFPSP